MPHLTRREFLARTAAAGGFAALLNACGSSVPAALVAQARDALQPFQFTDAQRRALTAAVARLIPAGAPGDWSAADAGAVEYIEQLLNAFVTAGNPRLYGGGPTRPEFAAFWQLSRIKQVGWMAEIARLRKVYADGLDELNRLARGPAAIIAGEFSATPAPEQDLILETQDAQNTKFFAALYAHTMEAVYSHPVYGGNKDYVGWKSVGYQGDVHGVRFPGGYDPNADQEPWRKYGGYSPEEMGQAGSGEGPST